MTRSLKSLAMAAVIAASATMTSATSLVMPYHARGGKIYRDLAEAEMTAHRDLGILQNATANYFDQLIWHNDTSKGTFAQKWYVDYSFWDQTAGPIFLYISGEGPAGSSPGGYAAVVAQKLNALMFTLEHRFYGESMPAPLTDRETLSTLAIDTVMEDLAAFITYINQQIGNDNGQHQWVVIGGSYAGALSAWFREKHPELAAVSWSSSGVVNAIFNFTAFDQQIVEDVDTECYNALRAVTSAFEDAWAAGGQTKQDMLDLFGTPSYFTQTDMAWMLADSAAMGPQYGYKDALCSYMVPLTSTPLVQFANWTNTHYGPGFGAQCYYSTVCLSDPSYASQWPNQRPWVFQCCNELAYWQAGYPGSYRSQLITTDYYVAQCQSAFGPETYPNTTAFNGRYGGSTPNATRVVALNGSDDPWKRAAVNQTLSSSYPMYTATCDGCGHCGDLHAPSAGEDPAITTQHDAIFNFVSTWLAEAQAEADAKRMA